MPSPVEPLVIHKEKSMKPSATWAKSAYQRGIRDRKSKKPLESNPYRIFGYSDDAKASWWVTGWQAEEKMRKG